MADFAKKARIVIVEHDDQTCKTIQKTLHDAFSLWFVKDVTAIETMHDSLDPEIIIVDGDRDAERGLGICQKIREIDALGGTYTGLILNIQDGDSPHILTGANAGVDCFCMKTFIAAQLPAVIQAVTRLRNLTDTLRSYSERLLANNLELENLVITDELTGLFNMRYVKKRLLDEFSQAQDSRGVISVIMIDIDHFKEVNDGADHLLGSYVIGEVGREIFRVTRRLDIPGRYGGDEFIVVLPATDEQGARSVAERLHDRIMSRVYSNGVDATQITISQGIAVFDGTNPNCATAEDLIRKADHALYQAKDAGRNTIVVFESPLDYPTAKTA